MDSSEFNRIVDKFADVVFRSALNFCGNKSDAEDITQNVFIKLLKSNVGFENDDHIRKWLIRVTANESKSLWRSFWNKKVISFQDLDYELAYIEYYYNFVCLLIRIVETTAYMIAPAITGI